MAKVSLREVFIFCSFIIIINTALSLILILWVTDDDLNNLPQPWGERLASIFYYLITTFTTTGYGDIYAKSVRMKLIISFYMIIIFALTVSFIFDF